MACPVLICDKTIDITSLLRAFAQFQEGVRTAQTQLEKDGTFQRFEFTFELLWKMLRRVLTYKGVEVTSSPRDVFREAGVHHLIDDATVWFEILKKRNLSVHLYDEGFAKGMFPLFPSILIEMAKVIETIKKV